MELFISKIARKINELLADIKKREFSVLSIILFGSAARNKLKPRSDMDICIVTNEDRFSKAVMEVEMYIDNFVNDLFPVDYIVCTPETLERRDRVFNSIFEEGKIIWRPTGK